MVILVACGLVIWPFAGLPVQPAHVAIARVEAIVPQEGRFHANVDRIYLRNSRGSEYFSLLFSDDHCQVGEQVPVEQRGTTLTPLPTTCKGP